MSAKVLGDTGDRFIQGDCIKEKCAWYYPTTQQCAVDRIASNLSGVNNALLAILQAIPRISRPGR